MRQIHRPNTDSECSLTNFKHLMVPVVLLLSSFNLYAKLSAVTVGFIQGNPPYLTVDGGNTAITTTDELLAITLSDGQKYTSLTNPSSVDNPIELPAGGQTFADIEMLIPADVAPTSGSNQTQKVNLSTLIDEPYNYWGDDDGDGLREGEITATGALSVTITDSQNQQVSRSEKVDVCRAPYQVQLSNTSSSLSTKYGLPNTLSFDAANATYYIKPKVDSPYACWAQPNLKNNGGSNNGPASMWSSTLGFKLQS